MTFYLNFFLPAVGLLWMPWPLLTRRPKNYVSRQRVAGATLIGLGRAWQNWVDLVRSGVGTYALLELSIGLEVGSGDAGKAALVKQAVLVVGVLLQTLRLLPGQGFVAPLFYLTGLTLVLPGYELGGFAVAMGWLFTCGARDPRFLLPVMGVAVLVSAYFLGGISLMVLLNVALILGPLALSVLLQRRLTFMTREPRTSRYQAGAESGAEGEPSRGRSSQAKAPMKSGTTAVE